MIEPRHTETARAATWHLPIAPKATSPCSTASRTAHILLREGWFNRDYIEPHQGIFPIAAFVAKHAPRNLTDAAGISEGDAERLVRLERPGKRVSFWWTMGVNQSH